LSNSCFHLVLASIHESVEVYFRNFSPISSIGGAKAIFGCTTPVRISSSTFDIRQLPELKVEFLLLAFIESKNHPPNVHFIIDWFRTRIGVILEPKDVFMFLRYISLFRINTTDCLMEYDAFQVILSLKLLTVTESKDLWCRRMTEHILTDFKQQETNTSSFFATLRLNLWNDRKVFPSTPFENIEDSLHLRRQSQIKDRVTEETVVSI
jgi:hypothetical protein